MQFPIRVLHVIGNMDQGGIESLLMSLYRNIDRKIIQFDFLTHTKRKGFFDNEIKALGGRVYEVISPFSIKGIFFYQSQLRNFFKKKPHFNIVHSHMNTFSGIILIAAKAMGIETRIAHSHTTVAANKLKTPMWKLSKLFGQKAITHRFTCSKEAAVWSFGKYADTARLFKNAIDVSMYNFNQSFRNDIRDNLNLKNKFVIGHVGRFNEIKNHPFLIDVFANYLKINKDSVLILIGDGPLKQSIKLKVNKLKIENSVIFLGNRNDVNILLCAMDIFVFPSINEGLGIVAIEAQASGLPCLVSSALPKEVKITENLEYASLKDGPEHWANRINKLKGNDRINTYKSIVDNGYDIIECSEWLTGFYVDCNEKVILSE